MSESRLRLFQTMAKAALPAAAICLLLQGQASAQVLPFQEPYRQPLIIGPPNPPMPPTPTKWLGNKRMAVILISLTDEVYPLVNPISGTGPTLTVQQVHDVISQAVFTNAKSTNEYWQDVSFDKFWVSGFNNPVYGDIFGPVAIDFPRVPCVRDEWVAAAQQALVDDPNISFDVNNYDIIAYSNKGPCSSVGRPGYDPPSAFMDNFSLRATTHELGHAIGLAHSSSIHCSEGETPVTLNGNCTVEEYGDIFDTMGDTGTMTYNQQKRGAKGWLDAADTLTVTSSGIYNLYPIESSPSSSQVKVLRVPRVTGPYGMEQYYYIELRQPSFFDVFGQSSALAKGTLIRLAPGYDRNGRSYLLDAKPRTFEMNDAPFVPFSETEPAVLTDPATGTIIKITKIVKEPLLNATYAQVDITPGMILTCTFGDPGVMLTPSVIYVKQGETKLFDITLTNGDSVECPPVPIGGVFSGIPEQWANESINGFEATLFGAEIQGLPMRQLKPGANAPIGMTTLTLDVMNGYTGKSVSTTLIVHVEAAP